MALAWDCFPRAMALLTPGLALSRTLTPSQPPWQRLIVAGYGAWPPHSVALPMPRGMVQ